jgi:hypothetical protein
MIPPHGDLIVDRGQSDDTTADAGRAGCDGKAGCETNQIRAARNSMREGNVATLGDVITWEMVTDRLGDVCSSDHRHPSICTDWKHMYLPPKSTPA